MRFLTTKVRTNYGELVCNEEAINADLVKSISKGNIGSGGFYTIRFNGIDIQWVFRTEELRDRVFSNIVDGKSPDEGIEE